MPIVAKQRVHFGVFELDTRAGELYKHELKLKLQGHPIQILAMLLERPGELITREEIQQELWPSESETFVDFEHGLNTAVRKLRQALGDEAETPQYIETLPRRGYRFVGTLTGEAAAGADPSNASQGGGEAHHQGSRGGGTVPNRRSARLGIVMIGLAALLGITAWALRGKWGRPAPLQVVATRQITFVGRLGSATGISENYRSIQTDGRRVYFATNTPERPLRSVATGGGEEQAIPTTLKVPVILHLSPDGAFLLVREELSDKATTEAPVWLIATNGGASRRLGEVVAQDAAFAPDNETIVFAKGRELFLTDRQGLSPVKLAEAPGHLYWLRWSPNGKHLRFSVQDKGSLQSTLWEMGADRKLRRLLADWDRGQQVCCGIWTADGRHFLFLSGGLAWFAAEPMADGARPVMLNSSGLFVTAAAANPLGREIFLSATAQRSGVYALDLKTDHAVVLYPEFRPQRLEYSRDQRYVAYRRQENRANELWIMRPDGSDRRQIVAAPATVQMARFSADSKRLAFMSRAPDKPWKIYWGDVEGGVWHEIPGPPENQCDPNWSPDGNTIVFGMPPEFMAEPNVERYLYSYDLRIGKTVRLEGTAGLFSPRWSPDGRFVGAMHIDFNGMSLWDVTQPEWKPFFAHDVDNPFWSPDSKSVYFNGHYDENLWRARVADGKVEKVMAIPMNADYTGCFANGFTPDGRVLVSCLDSQRNVYALELK